MRILIAIDSFKGSITSLEAGHAAADGIRRVFPEAEITVCPLADGGEGTVGALTPGLGGVLRTVRAEDPLGRSVDCQYGVVESGQLAIIEMAAAAGLTLLAPEERDPLRASTYGVGQVIRDAIGAGCNRFLIGIGGSATNDGGAGMLQALGYRLICEDGREAGRGGGELERIREIRDDRALPELAGCVFRIACDVTNPLCGPSGASAVYGPQKGATPEMVARLDAGLSHFAEVMGRFSRRADPAAPGAGAAGGLGFAFLSCMNASLEPGVQLVLSETRIGERIAQADLVITGEGRLDGQTVMGKAPVGVAKLAKTHEKPVLAFAGSVTRDAAACNEAGIDAYFPILRSVTTLEDAMEPSRAKENLRDTAEQVMRVMRMKGI